MSGHGRFSKILLLLSIVYFLQVVLSGIVLYNITVSQTGSFIKDISRQATEDISYTNGAWDISKYVVDPEIPGPYRVYVISNDGFVVDRWRPIPGYLDTSDVKQLLQYQEPTSIHTITGQDWRLVSLPIYDGEHGTLGAIAVGSFGLSSSIQDVDRSLEQAGTALLSKIRVQGSKIDVSHVNVRQVPFNISFQVVDQYNRILVKSNNASSVDSLPNFIDPSYLTHELSTPSIRKIRATGKESFLVQATQLTADGGRVFGTVIVARTISPHFELAKRFSLCNALLGLLFVPLASVLIFRVCTIRISKQTDDRLTPQTIQNIGFIKKESSIHINDQYIRLTFATNQYYMCLALFAQPKKRWEVDELLERFGETDTLDDWRKVYDAMVSINKKTQAIMKPKLIIVNNKTYQLNPVLIDKLVKTI